MAEVIQVDYEQLATIAKRFDTSANQITEMRQQLRQRTTRLRRSWEGKAAIAFLTEWDQTLEPALQRLIQALQQAGATTQQISRVLAEAEQEAARLFQSQPTNPGTLANATPLMAMIDVPGLMDAISKWYDSWPDWLKDVIKGIFIGDFSGDLSLPGIIAQIVVGFIPFAGQVANVRDIVAAIIDVFQGDDIFVPVVFLVISVAAIIPGLDALKLAKVLKPVLKALGPKKTWELVEFIVKNPSEIGRVGRTLGELIQNPQLIQTLAQHPNVAFGLIKHGSPEAVQAIIKGGPDALANIAAIGSKYPNDAGYIVSQYHRYDDLTKDPAHVGIIDVKGMREAEVGLALEGRGDLPQPITRYPTPAAEFTDANGQAWDIKGFNSNFPPRQGGFEVNAAMRQVKKELGNNENVIIDTEKMTPQHIQDLKNAIANDPTIDPSKIKWYP
jgi:WXG100 family type VII secretion target